MSEYFERLDTNNYNDELDYMLDNGIFTFDDYKNLYQNEAIGQKQWEKIKDYYSEDNK